MGNQVIFVGIDVAMAKKKRMPVAIVAERQGRLQPLPVRSLEATRHLKPPQGRGNAAVVLDAERSTAELANAVGDYIAKVADCLGAEVACIAIDSPASYAKSDLELRSAESALTAAGLSFFRTLSRGEFGRRLEAAERHLAKGGGEANLPNANLFWMLEGFALFDCLRRRFPGVALLEVYPQATFWALGAAQEHKSSPAGLKAQQEALEAAMGLANGTIARESRALAYGSSHDVLDAVSAAWVASLPAERRRLLGTSLADGIVIPSL